MSCLQDQAEKGHACSVRAVTIEPALPPPAKFQHKAKFQRSKTPGASTTPDSKRGVAGHVVVSLHRPHMITHVSDQLCNLLDYMQKQLSNRSINILYGPNTNQAALGAAIIKTGSLEKSSCKVEIYCRVGTPHETTAIISPVTVNGMPVACLIEFADWDIKRRSAISPIFSCNSRTPQLVFETHLRQYYQKRSNFNMGLSIECASRHACAQRMQATRAC